ncbi:MAG: DUF4287 domain-containing protein [Acidobacteria bacterium]|nr:DUF4287 domain-containing protein [Acidobacteriota bacterium]
MSKPGSETVYSVHPAVAYSRTIVENLPATTGRSMEEWVALIEAEGPVGKSERRDWLKKEHGLGGTKATMIATWSVGEGEEDIDPQAYLAAAPGMVEALYEGPKAALRPIHDALLAMALELGDVRVCPCTTIVPLYRAHVFAQIKPATRKRVDLGLALKGVREEIPPRVLATGGLEKGDRITHRIPIETLAEIDDEVRHWLRVAYDLDG